MPQRLDQAAGQGGLAGTEVAFQIERTALPHYSGQTVTERDGIGFGR
jgi:hypothetical protein